MRDSRGMGLGRGVGAWMVLMRLYFVDISLCAWTFVCLTLRLGFVNLLAVRVWYDMLEVFFRDNFDWDDV